MDLWVVLSSPGLDFGGFLELCSSTKIALVNHGFLAMFLLDFVVQFDYLLQTAFYAQSLKICTFLGENNYFSIIGVLAQGLKSPRKTINWRLETNINVVGKNYYF